MKLFFKNFFKKFFSNNVDLVFVRFFCIHFISVVSYLLTFFVLFVWGNIIESILYLIIFFVSFHFSFIEIHFVKIKKIIIFFILITLFELIFLYILYSNIQILLSLIFFNLAVCLLALNLRGESTEKTRFYAGGYFFVGGYIFTIFSTIAYSFFIIGNYNKFPFSCEYMQSSSNSFIEYLSKPIKFGRKEFSIIKTEAKDIKDKIKYFFDKDDLIKIESNSTQNKFLETISYYKKLTLDNAIKEGNLVNFGICEYVLSKINSIFSSPGYQITVIFLIYLIGYPFVRILFFIVSLIGFFIFKILFYLKVYKLKKTNIEVEDIY